MANQSALLFTISICISTRLQSHFNSPVEYLEMQTLWQLTGHRSLLSPEFCVIIQCSKDDRLKLLEVADIILGDIVLADNLNVSF